jgi:hypothetical protein
MRLWRRWLIIGVAFATAGLVLAPHHGPQATAAAVDDSVTQSQALVAARDLPADERAGLDGSRAAALADDIAPRIPLPAGGTFNGIRWKELDGTIGAPDVQVVVEYNAACQWYRALRDGREPDTARSVIADIPRWQATRDRGTAELTGLVADDVRAGGGPALTGVLRDCDASHESEVRYARERGTIPPA